MTKNQKKKNYNPLRKWCLGFLNFPSVIHCWNVQISQLNKLPTLIFVTMLWCIWSKEMASFLSQPPIIHSMVAKLSTNEVTFSALIIYNYTKILYRIKCNWERNQFWSFYEYHSSNVFSHWSFCYVWQAPGSRNRKVSNTIQDLYTLKQTPYFPLLKNTLSRIKGNICLFEELTCKN
jgi:hypothetical protein